MSAIKVTLNEASFLINDILDAGLVANILGSPGLGKSDIMRKVAKSRNKLLLDIRLTTMDPTEMNGFPFMFEVTDGTRRASYVPMDTFPLEDWPLPEGYEGWHIFFDEANSCSKAVEAAAYKIVLDKMVGAYKLHPNVDMTMAGNLVTDNAIAGRAGTAMQSRVVTLIIRACVDGWQEWAIEHNIDARVRGFINFRPKLLHFFEPDKSQKETNFPCPRTWEFTSKLCKIWGPEIKQEKLAAIAGCLGEGTARSFYSFSQIYSSLPSYEYIVERPRQVTFDNEPGTEYAVVELITEKFQEKDLGSIMEFIPALSIDLQAILLRGLLKKNVMLKNEAPVREWIRHHGKKLQRLRTA